MARVQSISFTLILVLLLFVAAAAETAPEAPGTAERHWNRDRIRIEASTSLLRNPAAIRPGSDVAGAIERSLAEWTRATGIEFEVEWTDRQSVSPSGRFGDGINLITIAPTSENLIALSSGRDEAEAAAKTRTFFGRRSEIVEADIVLSPTRQFSTDGSYGTFDLQSVLTHELGHLLGLGHSPVMGATMYDRDAPNGIFGLNSLMKRSLALSDVSAARALYLAGSAGAIIGRPVSFARKDAFAVWAEDPLSRRVVAGVFSDDSGAFRLGGLDPGQYRLFVQTIGNDERMAAELGIVVVVAGRDTRIQFPDSGEASFPADFLGFNGQFADFPIAVSAGGDYRIEIQDRSSAAATRLVRCDAPMLAFHSDTAVSHRLGTDLTISEAMVRVDEFAAEGEYSVAVVGGNSGARYFIGILSVGEIHNPWIFYGVD